MTSLWLHIFLAWLWAIQTCQTLSHIFWVSHWRSRFDILKLGIWVCISVSNRTLRVVDSGVRYSIFGILTYWKSKLQEGFLKTISYNFNMHRNKKTKPITRWARWNPPGRVWGAFILNGIEFSDGFKPTPAIWVRNSTKKGFWRQFCILKLASKGIKTKHKEGVRTMKS